MKKVLNFTIIIVAIGCIFINNTIMNKKINGIEKVIYIAKDNIQQGTELKKDMLLGIKVNKDNISDNYILNLNDIEGKIAKNEISQHQLILKNNLTTDKKDISNELVSISLSKNNSYIKKSDKINIYATYQVDKSNQVKIEIAKNKIVEDVSEKAIVVSLSKDELATYIDNLNSTIILTKIK